jgi:hypothetical protein
MIDGSKFLQNGLRRLAKQPCAMVAAASLFGILSYRMVSLGQFDSKVAPWRQGKQTFHSSSSIDSWAGGEHHVTPTQHRSYTRYERFETSEI